MGSSSDWGTKIPPAPGQLSPCPTTREAHVLQQRPRVAKNKKKKRNANCTGPDMWAGTFTPSLPSNYHKSQTSLLSLLSRVSLWRLPHFPESLIMWVINLVRSSWDVCDAWTWGDGAHPKSSGWHGISRQWPPLRVCLHSPWPAHQLNCLLERLLPEPLLASLHLSYAAACWRAHTELAAIAEFFQASVISNQLKVRNCNNWHLGSRVWHWDMCLGLDPSACLRLNCTSQFQLKPWLSLGCREWPLSCDHCMCLH